MRRSCATDMRIGVDQDFLHAVRGVPYHQVRIAIDTVFRERSPINLAEVELESVTGENGRYVNLSGLLILLSLTQFLGDGRQALSFSKRQKF